MSSPAVSSQPANCPKKLRCHRAQKQKLRCKQVHPKLDATFSKRKGKRDCENCDAELNRAPAQLFIATVKVALKRRLRLQLPRCQPLGKFGGAQGAVANNALAGDGPAEKRVVVKHFASC